MSKIRELCFLLSRETFIRGPALFYFMDLVKKFTCTTSSAIDILESPFLDDRTTPVKDEFVWNLNLILRN